MTEIISRNFLHPNIEFYDNDAGIKYAADFNDTITFWKTILYEGYNLRPGNSVVIYDTSLRFDYVCLVLAAAELGLKLILTPEKPSSVTGKDAKLDALVKSYGIIDLAIIDNVCANMPAIVASATRYSKKVIQSSVFSTYNIVDHSIYNQMKNTVSANNSDELIITTTSGSTGEPKLIVYTHQQLFRIGKRNVQAYNYTGTSTCHTRNMHHAFVLLCHFLPSLTGIQTHHTNTFPMVDNHHELLALYQTLSHYKIDNVVLSYKSMLDNLIALMIDRKLKFDHKITFIVGGFYITNDYVEKIRLVNVDCLISTFGSNETLAPILLRHIYQNTSTNGYQPNFLGLPCDDYYKLSVTEDHRLSVECKDQFDSAVVMDDRFDGDINNGFYHHGRDNFYRIDHRDFSLHQLNAIVKNFVTGDFNITIDLPYQRIYLVLWEDAVLTDFAQLNQELRESTGVEISIWDQLNKIEYSDFKLNHDKIRLHFRQKGSSS
jgi:hypothetical protein